MQTIATDHYKQGKGNCAQSVAAAWTERFGSDEDYALKLAACGRGRAPEGLCGALYAAKCILGDEKAEAVLKAFSEKTGGRLTCADIRQNRAIPCVECVRVAAGLLQEASKN